MASLETKLQELFLWNYDEFPREKMLIEFIELHSYAYQRDQTGFCLPLGPDDPDVLRAIGTGGPAVPPYLTEAIEELASRRGSSPVEVVKSLFLKPKSVASHNHFGKNCHLSKEYADLYNSYQLGKWLN